MQPVHIYDLCASIVNFLLVLTSFLHAVRAAHFAQDDGLRAAEIDSG
jgi:hypothetical protein